MSGPSIDLEKPNAIGGLDRLVTNFALAAIAVLPTFWACVATPGRLRPQLDGDDPDGRDGMLLAPGAYFPLALMVSLLAAAILATPETINTNGSFLGPGLAVAVQTAASEGDIWKIVATIMPIYGVSIFLGVLGRVLTPWAGPEWTLRVSLRAAFYIFGTFISWVVFTTALIDLVQLHTGSFKIAQSIYPFVTFPALIWLFWIYFCFFRNGGIVSRPRSAALSLAMFGLIACPFLIADLLIRLF